MFPFGNINMSQRPLFDLLSPPASVTFNVSQVALFRMRDLVVDAGAGFNATIRGYAREQGPGKGSGASLGSGAGHGGRGGKANTGASVPGIVYGDTNAPIHAGSGGGHMWGGRGGGTVRIQASKQVTLNGALTANSQGGVSTHGGGGAGGSIHLWCQTFTSSTGATLYAKGGAGNNRGGGGGGGRIAVWIAVPGVIRDNYLLGIQTQYVERTVSHENFTGLLSVTNGAQGSGALSDPPALPGTAYFYISKHVPGSVFMIR